MIFKQDADGTLHDFGPTDSTVHVMLGDGLVSIGSGRNGLGIPVLVFQELTKPQPIGSKVDKSTKESVTPAVIAVQNRKSLNVLKSQVRNLDLLLRRYEKEQKAQLKAAKWVIKKNPKKLDEDLIAELEVEIKAAKAETKADMD